MYNTDRNDLSLIDLFDLLDVKTQEYKDVPPYMRRYESMVDEYKKSKLRKPPLGQETDTYLGAPIQKNNDFLGITYAMNPAPDYLPLTEKELILKREVKCTMRVIPETRDFWKIGEARRHRTFSTCHEILYFPMIYGKHHFETEFARYLWLVRSYKAKPDADYIHQLQRSYIRAAQRFKRVQNKMTISRLVLNDSIYCLNWLSYQTRQQIIKILAETFRTQKEVLWISAENTQLGLDDGLRLLFLISVTSGLTLITLHLWHFFRDGLLPIHSNEDPLLGEIFVKEKIEIGERIIRHFYYLLIIRANYTIPPLLRLLVLHSSFHCLEYLRELSVEYRYLAAGEGESLLYLGCIRNGTLRVLNLLYTQADCVEHSKRYICPAAWKNAFKQCPNFRVNLVSLRVPSYSMVIPVLVQYMPLGGFFTSAGFKCDDVPLYLETITNTLIKYYKRFLSRLTIHVIRPRLRVDFCLSKLLTELTFLEELVYRGPIDCVTTLHCFFKYIETYPLRIKKLHIFLTEDPCQPQAYKNKMSEIHKQYEPSFVDKGIDFMLGTC